MPIRCPSLLKHNSSARLLPALLLALLLPLSVRADVKMPAIFGDHMVLQGGIPAPVWGTADPGEAVTVKAGEVTAHATAGSDGKWMAKLVTLHTSGTPIDVTVTGKNTITFHDVLVGDVWLCSGQSNMEYALAGKYPQHKRPFGGDAQQAKFVPEATDTKLRFFLVKKAKSETPAADVKAEWTVCTPATASTFSGVGYFFGRDLRASLKRPIGLIGSYWGGTKVEPWTPSPEAAQTSGQAPQPGEKVRPLGGKVFPTGVLFNGMISPLIPYALKGAIWYQGESNTDEAQNYHQMFSTMIQDWRKLWGEGDFTFLYVQLAAYHGRAGQDWPLLREAQVQTLSLPKTGMASAVDLGNPGDIHPSDKFDVGHRLALAARHVAYGEDIVSSGPLYKGMTVSGDAIRVTFIHMGAGLVIGQTPWLAPRLTPLSSTSLVGFTIAGADQKWFPAEAKIDGDAVIVSSPQVTSPAAVRYEWENAPRGNLYNKENLPASPFRTDDWNPMPTAAPAPAPTPVPAPVVPPAQ